MIKLILARILTISSVSTEYDVKLFDILYIDRLNITDSDGDTERHEKYIITHPGTAGDHFTMKRYENNPTIHIVTTMSAAPIKAQPDVNGIYTSKNTGLLKFTGGTFSILTSPLRGDHEVSSKYKKKWIQQHIEKPAQTIITGRKETYAKDKASGTPNILIDDRPVNIERWQGAGGYGILYQANRDPLTKVQTALDQYGKV